MMNFLSGVEYHSTWMQLLPGYNHSAFNVHSVNCAYQYQALGVRAFLCDTTIGTLVSTWNMKMGNPIHSGTMESNVGCHWALHIKLGSLINFIIVFLAWKVLYRPSLGPPLGSCIIDSCFTWNIIFGTSFPNTHVLEKIYLKSFEEI